MKTILFILMTIGLSLLCWRFPYAFKTSDDKMNIIYLVAILTVFILNSGKFKVTEVVRSASIWLGILLVVLIGYSYRHAILNNQLLSNLLPLKPLTNNDGSLMLTAADDGHFHVEASFNEQVINCMIDTGASDIVLDIAMATSIGIVPSSLSFNIKTNTANGIGSMARAKTKSLSIGSITLFNTNIAVNKEAMDTCLLGMSFLNQMSSFTVKGDQLIIQP